MSVRTNQVLLLASTFPPQIGGAESYLHHLYTRLPAGQVVVCAAQTSGGHEFDANSPLRTVRVQPELFSAYWQGRRRRAPAFLLWSWLCLRHRATLIAASRTLPEGIVAWMFHQVWKTPYIVHTYGLDFLRPAQNEWGRFYVRRVLEAAAHVTACSHFTADRLSSLGAHPDCITTIYPGVDLERFRPADPDTIATLKERLGLRDRRVLLTVGRLVPRKGHRQVLAAMPRVIAQVPDLCYLIVGDGPERPALKKHVHQQGLESYVRFTGQVSETELPHYYQIADLFILPNRDLSGDVEGFGIVFLEAGACGVPVIGGASGGAQEAIVHNKTGLLINPERTDEIVQAMLDLLSDSDRRQAMGREGQAHACSFSWDRAAQELRALLERLPASRPWATRLLDLRTGPRLLSTLLRPN